MNCKVCHRIPPKIIRDSVYKVCEDSEITRKEKHILFKKTLDIILFLDKNSFVLCGKYQKSIIGASLYIAGILTGIRKVVYNTRESLLTQRQIYDKLGVTECAIRTNHYKFVDILKNKGYIKDEII